MFDYSFRAQLKAVKVEADETGPTVLRTCRIGLEVTLDAAIARGIAGEAGVDTLARLRDRTIEKVVFPIDAITAKADLKGPVGWVSLPCITGIRASATAGKVKEDEPDEEPKVKLEFGFPYSRDVWCFLGDNAIAWIDITLTKNQMELALVKPLVNENDGKSVKNKKREAEPLWSAPLTAPPRGAAEEPPEDRTDEQMNADTPEEAEAMREERLGAGGDAEKLVF